MKITNYEDINLALKRLAEIQVKTTEINGEVTLRCNEIKEEKNKEIAILDAEKSILEGEIEKFCSLNKKDFIEKRSRDFTFGSIGFRLTTSVKIPKDKLKIAALIESIRALGLKKCIRYEEKVDRDQICALEDAEIVKLGLKKEVRDSFRIEPNVEKLQN